MPAFLRFCYLYEAANVAYKEIQHFRLKSLGFIGR